MLVLSLITSFKAVTLLVLDRQKLHAIRQLGCRHKLCFFPSNSEQITFGEDSQPPKVLLIDALLYPIYLVRRTRLQVKVNA